MREKKPVYQLSPEGQVVAEYESMYQAAQKTGVRLTGISNVCNGWRRTSGGFGWSWKF